MYQFSPAIKRHFLLLFLLPLANMFCVVQAGEDVIAASWHTLESKVLKETRQFAVYLPPSYKHTDEIKYPVMYVLDGTETVIRGITGTVEMLSVVSGQIPEFIIIAVANTERERDFTPTKANLEYKTELLQEISNSGGANTFTQFLEKELIPLVSRQYKTSAVQLLAGHSFGGLFTAHVLLEKPQLFSEYLILDATFIWDNNYINRRAEQVLKNSDFTANVYIALANNQAIGEKGMANLEWGQEFSRKLQQHQSNKFMSTSRYFPNESHGTITLTGWYHGLLHLYGKNQ